ncbi:MAG: diacylglycerol kinase family lipid kinase [Acidobacteriota bacterium]|nr:diacylglycerol kinase family lipid kinase [Acidobacteriota bacterium]
MPSPGPPAILVYNPRAGRWPKERLVADLVRELATDGPPIEAHATRGRGDATALAREASAAGAPIVFALGGDGTLREAAAGLLGSDTVLGVLPGGTANVVARALGLPAEPLAAARALKGLPALAIDVGRCGDEIFLMQASLGLDARALRAVSPLAKRWLGRAAVVLAGLGAWWRHDDAEFELLVDGHSVGATFAAACNLAFYGGDARLAPGARPDDGLLDVVLFRGAGRRATLAFVRDVLAGRHLERDDVSVLKAVEVVILDPDVALQIDGDPIANRLGTEIRLAGQRLRILAPSTIMSPR